MKPLLITTGEPAGIGPDVSLMLAAHQEPVVLLGDMQMLLERVKMLSLDVELKAYDETNPPSSFDLNTLYVKHMAAPKKVTAGQLDKANSEYVVQLLETAVDLCLAGAFSGLVTAPVQKSIINEAGINFKGHTELLARRCNKEVVMMLASKKMRVALVTTHLPLKEVPGAISQESLEKVIQTTLTALKDDFGIQSPVIYVAGLNPHAGEGGYLGREEIETISPVIERFRAKGDCVQGPFSADTMFCQEVESTPDAYIAMYHDQGLPVLKYASFGQGINVTLGLPIIRTSVDHGTALGLAGTGQANPKSMYEAVRIAKFMAKQRYLHG